MSHTSIRKKLSAALVCVALTVPAASSFAQPKSNKTTAAKKAAVKVDVRAELARLVGTDVEAAEQAAGLLGAVRDPQALDGLLDALSMGIAPKVAATALGSLGAHGSIKAFDVAAYYAHHRDARVRAAAIRALGSLDDKRAVAITLDALRDGSQDVRAAAAEVATAKKLRPAIEPLLALLKKGDEPAAPALAALGDAELARVIGELIGKAPDAQVARALGLILLRPEFGPEAARVEVVRTLGKVPGTDAIEQLTAYLEATPEKPPRQSRREAEALVEARLTGGM